MGLLLTNLKISFKIGNFFLKLNYEQLLKKRTIKPYSKTVHLGISTEMSTYLERLYSTLSNKQLKL